MPKRCNNCNHSHTHSDHPFLCGDCLRKLKDIGVRCIGIFTSRVAWNAKRA